MRYTISAAVVANRMNGWLSGNSLAAIHRARKSSHRCTVVATVLPSTVDLSWRTALCVEFSILMGGRWRITVRTSVGDQRRPSLATPSPGQSAVELRRKKWLNVKPDRWWRSTTPHHLDRHRRLHHRRAIHDPQINAWFLNHFVHLILYMKKHVGRTRSSRAHSTEYRVQHIVQHGVQMYRVQMYRVQMYRVQHSAARQ